MRFWIALVVAGGALAQQPPGGDNMVNMQSIAQGLGVKCEYCHTGQRGESSPKQDIARAMIAMTRDINTKILAATGKPPTEATRVTCITCHRGVAIPGQLSDIITKTALRDGPDLAVAQYRELRAQYYGRRVTISGKTRCSPAPNNWSGSNPRARFRCCESISSSIRNRCAATPRSRMRTHEIWMTNRPSPRWRRRSSWSRRTA